MIDDRPSSAPSRRRFLATATAAVAAPLAGCSGLAGGPDEVDARTVTTDGELVWVYPADVPSGDSGDTRGAWDANGIGYGSIGLETATGTGKHGLLLRFDFNSTVGGIASGEAYERYQADWFRFRLGPPRDFEGPFAAYVTPPQSFRVETRYGRDDRTLVVEAPAVDTEGTILVEGRAHLQSLPDQLQCAFTVQASQEGRLGRTVRASDRETVDLSAVADPGPEG